jgi:hypothetical protein
MKKINKKALLNNKWFQLVVIFILILTVSRYAWNKNMQDIQTERTAEASNVLVDSNNLTSLLEAELGKDEVKDVLIQESAQGLLVTIAYDPGKVWNEKSLLKKVAEASYKAFPLCFSDEQIISVTIEVSPKNKHFIHLNLLREDALELDWDTLSQDTINDYTLAYTNASVYEVHEALIDYLP